MCKVADGLPSKPTLAVDHYVVFRVTGDPFEATGRHASQYILEMLLHKSCLLVRLFRRSIPICSGHYISVQNI